MPVYKKLGREVKQLIQPLRHILSDRLDNIWLVGGTVRDLLTGQPPKDFDFAFAGDLTPQIKRWAAQQGGHWFWLDKQRNQSRVIFTALGLQFDFSPLRAADICADLRLRDFTLNAMALPFNHFPENMSALLDPLNGRQDLEHGLLRSCGPGVLSDDPLRCLKGIRHHALRGWSFETQTAIQVTQAAPLLGTVAGERLRNELGQILDSPRLTSAIKLMAEFTILKTLLPGIATHELIQELDLLTARIEQLGQFQGFASLLARPLEEGLTCRTLLFLAALLRRVEPLSSAEDIAECLRLSTRSHTILQALQGRDISLEDFSDSDTPRVAALKFETLGKNCLERILFTLARQPQNRQDRLLSNYVDAYLGQLVRGRIADLLNGAEIRDLTGMPTGQIIGDYQRRIKAAEIAGEISDKSSAESWLKRLFSD